MQKLLKLARENLVLLVLVVIIGFSYLLLRTPGDKVADQEQLDELLAAGKPVLVEMFSNT